MNSKLLPWALMLLLALPGVSQAALLSRLGGQAYYDTVLDITWLADANLADSNAFGVDGDINVNGSMHWNEANNNWIAAMNADGGTGYLGFDDWRLPTLSPISGGPSFQYDFRNNGTADHGYGATGIGWRTGAGDFVSEMGYMYYVNMARLGLCTPDNNAPAGCTVQPGVGPRNNHPFANLQLSHYWTGLEFSGLEIAPDPPHAWYFAFSGGIQGAVKEQVNFFFAWPVRSGDVAVPVPLPTMAIPFGICLMGLIGVNRGKLRMDASAI